MTIRHNSTFRTITLGTITALSALSIAACSPAEENPSTETTETTDTTHTAEETLTFTDGVVRAKGTDNAMTAIFGTFSNNTDDNIMISGFTAEGLDDAEFELHETVDGMMREVDEGFDIPAGDSRELAPGGDHMMIMGYTEEIPAGDVLTITVELSNGDTFDVEDIAVRTMNSGDEDYGEDGALQGHTHDGAH